MTRQAYVDQEGKNLLFWSPKSGCTSLVQWFVYGYLGVRQEDVRKDYSDARAWLRGEGYFSHFRDARKLVNKNGYSAIALVRHPATRVLSAFLNKFVVYQRKPIDAWEKHEPAIRRSLITWGLAEPGGEGFSGISFRQFLDQIEARMNATTKGEPQLDRHWNTQVPIAYGRSGFNYKKLLYLEDADHAFGWLNDHFGINYKMPVINRTKYEDAAVTIDAADMPSFELAAHPEYLNKENFLHKDILEQIARIYRIDYDKFGYDPFDITMVPDVHAGMKPEGQRAPEVSQQEIENAPPFEIHDNGAKKTIVAFGGLGLQLGMPVFEFRKALSSLGCNLVFFRDVHRSWYHADIKDFGATFEEKGNRIKSLIGHLADTELYTLGSSAGGFAALMFSAFIKPKATLLFGPQVFIDADTRNLLTDRRWHRLISQIESDSHLSVTEVADQIRHPVHIIVGNQDDLDMRHALYAKTLVDDTRIMVLTGGGHNPAGELRNAGVLQKVLEDFLAEKDIEEQPDLSVSGRRASLMKL